MQIRNNTTDSGNGRGVDGIQSTLAGSVSDITGEFRNFVTDVEDLIKATTSLTGEDLVRARAKLSARVAAAKDSVEEVGGSIIHRARKTAAMTNEYVHDQPWTSIGVGAAVGFLIGFVFARRT